MKLAIAGLIVLGVLAALSAALLMGSFRASMLAKAAPAKPAQETADVTVLVAARAAPAMTVLDSSMVVPKVMPRSLAPAGYVSSPTEVVGKVLTVAVTAEQALTAGTFATGTASHQLADVIPPGKRAVGISVTDYAGLQGLLFPGSMVDVLVCFKPFTEPNGRTRAATTQTLLQNVQVLALDQQSIVSPEKSIPQLDESANRSNSGRRVTLLVDSKQAKLLQVAMEQGTLSLALRNPLDATRADGDSVSIENLLGDGFASYDRGDSEQTPKWGEALLAAVTSLQKVAPPPAAAPPTTRPAQPAPQWETTVIRGDTVEKLSFPMPISAPR